MGEYCITFHRTHSTGEAAIMIDPTQVIEAFGKKTSSLLVPTHTHSPSPTALPTVIPNVSHLREGWRDWNQDTLGCLRPDVHLHSSILLPGIPCPSSKTSLLRHHRTHHHLRLN